MLSLAHPRTTSLVLQLGSLYLEFLRRHIPQNPLLTGSTGGHWIRQCCVQTTGRAGMNSEIGAEAHQGHSQGLTFHLGRPCSNLCKAGETAHKTVSIHHKRIYSLYLKAVFKGIWASFYHLVTLKQIIYWTIFLKQQKTKLILWSVSCNRPQPTGQRKVWVPKHKPVLPPSPPQMLKIPAGPRGLARLLCI